ncbi:MAG: hypothetical protein M3O30_01815 [Planctomycetota bacterium]|nr:hypothetical protein [Planctomycetota bacterium]
MRHNQSFSRCAFFFVGCLCAWPATGFSDSGPSVTAEAFDPNPSSNTNLIYSDNGLHVAFVGPMGSRYTGYFDGRGGKKYDEVSQTFGALTPQKQFIFSADGSHIAYMARSGQNRVIVCDGQETPLADQNWEVTEALFSPDGKQFAFADNPQKGESRVFLIDKEGTHYKKVSNLQFSANNKHLAYVAGIDRPNARLPTAVVVLDSTAGPEFTDITALAFSPDGEHCGYIGSRAPSDNAQQFERQYSLMIDGKELVKFDMVKSFQFSPDGQHVMYIAGKAIPGKKDMADRPVYDQVIGLDDQQWPYLQKIASDAPPPPALSPDGKRVAYVQAAGPDIDATKTVVMTVNGKKGEEYDHINQFAFSPDGQHLCYVALQGNAGGGPNGGTGRYFVVYDDNESGPYSIGSNSGVYGMAPTFSPDGKHYAIAAGDGTHRFVVADGKKQGDYDMILGPIVYSPDGQHLAYFASRDVMKSASPIQRQEAQSNPNFDPGKYVVLNGQENRLPPKSDFAPSAAVHFSPDSQHYAYVVKSRVVVDGRLVKPPEASVHVSLYDDAMMTFSTDSKHIIYTLAASTNGYGIQAVAIDGNIISDYCLVGLHLGVSENRLTYLARKGFQQGPLNRVTVELGSECNFGTIDTQVANTTPTRGQPQANNSQQSQQPGQPPAKPPVITPPKKVDDALNMAKHLFGN